jgi:hypothetical protein
MAFETASTSCCAGTVLKNSANSFESFVLQPSASPNKNALLRAADVVWNAQGLSAQPLCAMAREKSPGIEGQLVTQLTL